MPENIPSSGTLIFLYPNSNDTNKSYSERIISQAALPEDQQEWLERLWEEYSRGKDKVSVYQFIKEHLLDPLNASNFDGSRNSFLIDSASRQTTISFSFLNSPPIPGEEVYQFLYGILRNFAGRLVDVIFIELPDYDILHKLSGKNFIHEVDNLMESEDINLNKIKCLLEEMEMVSQSIQYRIKILQQAQTKLRQWIQEELKNKLYLES